MPFLPAGEILDDHQFRCIAVENSPDLPDGEYAFVDAYCTDNGCDCRKTIIQIYHDGEHVSTVDHGWEKPEFYKRWMDQVGDDASDMWGSGINFTSPNRIDPDATLALFEELLDDGWLGRIKDTYKKFRKAINQANTHVRPEPKTRRNDPCPCGSSKKYKRCCAAP